MINCYSKLLLNPRLIPGISAYHLHTGTTNGGNRRRQAPRGRLVQTRRFPKHIHLISSRCVLTERERRRTTKFEDGEDRLTTPTHPPTLILPASSISPAGLPTMVNHRLGLHEHNVPYPHEIVDYLDSHVIGQDEAKRVLAVGVYQHYLRLLHNLDVEETRVIRQLLKDTETPRPRNILGKKPTIRIKGGQAYFDVDPEEDFRNRRERLLDDLALGRDRMHTVEKLIESEMPIEKSNILLGGPSGSGKTYLTQKLAEILNVPMAMCDCTTLTQAGYVGDDVDSVIQKLLQNANGDVERAEIGIIFLDEIDKINSSADPVHSSSHRDVSGRGVQTGLLKLVEGHTIKVKNPLNPMQKVDVDTTNILFIGSGAFAGLDQIVAKRLEQKFLGFGSRSNNNKTSMTDNEKSDIEYSEKDKLTRMVDQGDLIEYGMIPELVGRFPVFVPFHSIDRNLMKRVLIEPRNNLISQAIRLFSLDGITLHFTECAIEAIADEASNHKTGARALRSIMERVLLKAKFKAPGSNISKIVFDGAAIRGERNFKEISKFERH